MQARRVVLIAWLGLAACGSKPGGEPADAPIEVDATPDAAVCTAPQAMCGETCTDVMTDVHNCGACGHVCGCGSTTCTAGVCDAHPIATDQGAPAVLALHDDKLYWGNDVDRTVSTAVTATGAVSVLYPGRTAVRGFAFDATRVYFSRAVFNIMESGALDGSFSGNFTNRREPGAAGVATDDVAAYWATYDGGTTGLIRSKPLGPPSSTGDTTLATGLVSPDGVALDATSVYFTTHTPTAGTVQRVAKAGGAAVVLAADRANPHSLAVVDGFVYWTDHGDGTPNTGSVQRVAITGGEVQTYAEHQPLPNTIAVRGGFVYWTDITAGTVMRVAIAGGTPAAVVVHEDNPFGLAVSDTCLYFTDYADGGPAGSVRSHDLE